MSTQTTDKNWSMREPNYGFQEKWNIWRGEGWWSKMKLVLPSLS
jgi:hypothetical protein